MSELRTELKVSSTSNPNAVAGAIASIIKVEEKISIQVVGAGALNQAIKAVAIARGFVVPTGIDLYCVPSFVQVKFSEEERTGIKLTIKRALA